MIFFSLLPFVALYLGRSHRTLAVASSCCVNAISRSMIHHIQACSVAHSGTQYTQVVSETSRERCSLSVLAFAWVSQKNLGWFEWFLCTRSALVVNVSEFVLWSMGFATYVRPDSAVKSVCKKSKPPLRRRKVSEEHGSVFLLQFDSCSSRCLLRGCFIELFYQCILRARTLGSYCQSLHWDMYTVNLIFCSSAVFAVWLKSLFSLQPTTSRAPASVVSERITLESTQILGPQRMQRRLAARSTVLEEEDEPMQDADAQVIINEQMLFWPKSFELRVK